MVKTLCQKEIKMRKLPIFFAVALFGASFSVMAMDDMKMDKKMMDTNSDGTISEEYFTSPVED
jgi:hypothetical protein